MNTKDIILKLRTEAGLSQDELADKLFVTRQAVSRRENGETVQNIESLKLLYANAAVCLLKILLSVKKQTEH